jgi:DNA-binding transcriptional LysR family regulator
LEEELGVQLFSRSAKGAELTAAGREFLAFAQASLAGKQRVLAQLSSYLESANKSVAVGMMPVLATYGVAGLIAAFHRYYPQFSLKVIEKSAGEILRLLDAGSLSLAIVGNGMTDPEKYEECPLLSGQDHFSRRRQSPAGLLLVRFSPQSGAGAFHMLNNGAGLDKIIFDSCRRAGFTPRVAYACSVVPSILSLVEEGLGIALLMEQAVKTLHTPNIKIIELNDLLLGDLVLVIAKERALNQASIAFRHFTLNWYGR